MASRLHDSYYIITLFTIYKIIKIDVAYRERMIQQTGDQDIEQNVRFLESLRHQTLTDKEIDRI